MYCIVTVVRFVIILIKFYVCMYVCMYNMSILAHNNYYYLHLYKKYKH